MSPMTRRVSRTVYLSHPEISLISTHLFPPPGDQKDNGMFGNFLNSPGGDWNNKFDDFNVDDEEEDSDDSIPSLSQNDEEGGEGDKEKKPAA